MYTQSGLGRWESELGQLISDAAIGEVRSHPQFSQACRMSALQSLALAKSDAVLHANFRDIGRMALGTLALYLHASGGLTHRRLCELASEGGTLSAGRATAILLRLRMIGYVKAMAKRADGSARLYVPTEKMIGAFRKRTAIEMDGIALIEPQIAAFSARLGENDVFFRLYKMAGERLMDAEKRRREDLREFETLIMRDAGMLIIYALFEATDTGGEFPAAGPAKISLAAFARRFGVSRTHVMRLMRDAEKLQFVARDADGDYGVILPKLRDAFALFYSIILISLAAMAHRVLEDMKAGAANANAQTLTA